MEDGENSLHAASLLLAFSYILAHWRAAWLVTRMTFSLLIIGRNFIRPSFAVKASLSVVKYLVSASLNVREQYLITLSTATELSSTELIQSPGSEKSLILLDSFIISFSIAFPSMQVCCNLLYAFVPFKSPVLIFWICYSMHPKASSEVLVYKW